jgi:hypothetical protein
VSQSRRAKVAAAVKSLRAFYALGRSLPRRPAHKDAYDQGTVEAEAARLGVNPDTVRKARQFADPVAGYTAAEVNDLCRLVSAVRPGQDDGYAVFGRTHLIRLLSVKKQYRAGLQEAAVRGGWSTAVLEAEIAARYGSRRDGGRKRRVPDDVLGRLLQAEAMCETWCRWASVATPPKGASPPLPPGGLPAEVVRLVWVATAAVAKLQAAAVAELTARRPGRAVRRQFRDTSNSGNGR